MSKLFFNLMCAGAAVLSVAGAELADESPTSVVRWICPDEPFPDGIGKMRYYRRTFETREGLVRAEARWWIDDAGCVYVDGGKGMPYSMAIDDPKDLTDALKRPGRHVLAVQGRNMAGSGGVCLSLVLTYADGHHETVYTDDSWRYTADAQERVPPGTRAGGGARSCATASAWTSVGFDDSGWQRVRAFADVLAMPWMTLADMSKLMLPDERTRRDAILAARAVRVEKALKAMEGESKPICKIVYEKGKPYFDIGGRRFETAFYNASENWNCDSAALRRQAAMFRDAGMHLYGVGVRATSVWREDGSIDFADAERKIRDVLSIDPEARFLVSMACDYPVKWWCRKHPDEMVGYANGAPDPAMGDTLRNVLAPSFASTVWRRDVTNFIARLVAHLESTPYAKRIYAYRPDFGVYHEWHYFGMARHMPDTGKAMTAAFRRWLEREYKGDVAALRRAWNRPDVTFATAEVPTKEERLRTSAGTLRDPVKDRPTLDYLRCHSEQVRDCLFDFNHAAKEACGGRALLGNYCGYFFEMPFPAEGWHLENEAILDSPYVDFQVSPFPYQTVARGGGNGQYSRRLLEATRRRGKLALMEADTRTTLTISPGCHLHAKSRAEDIALLARDFVSSLCWGCGFWYYDFGQGWYDAPEFNELFGKIFPIRQEITDCRSISEVLVVGDYESVLLTNAGSSRFNDERTSRLVHALGHTGVPFDSASVADLASGKLKDYKVYIFCNLHWMTSDKECLLAGLRAKGKAVVLPESPLTEAELRKLLAAHGVHIWDDDPRDVIYANVSCVALHSAVPGEKTIRLPRRAKVTMLYPERREIAADTDRIVFTPQGNGLSTTLFRTDFAKSEGARAEKLPPLPDGAFTYVVIPDTQLYRGEGAHVKKGKKPQAGPTRNPAFASRVDWIVANIEKEKIAFVSHVGDIVDFRNAAQWAFASSQMAKLDGKVPYGISPGNHDIGGADTTEFNTWFPRARYETNAWYAGSFGGYVNAKGKKVCADNADSCQLFEAGGMKFVVLHLECNAPAPVLAWVDKMLNKYADRSAIICTHMYLGYATKELDEIRRTSKERPDAWFGVMDWTKCHGKEGVSAAKAWETCFSKHKNLILIVSGDQSPAICWRVAQKGLHGNTVHATLQDYPRTADTEDWLRLYRFRPAERRIDVWTYSPQQDRVCGAAGFRTGRDWHVFTLPLDGFDRL